MNLEYAKQQFEKYLDNYDREDDKVRLKIIHTYGTMDYSGRIAERMGLSGEDAELARLTALLHDIGRFEQLRRYNSFEPGVMDHAAFGVQILFGEGMIRDFIEEETWDAVLRTAIGRHSDFKLEGISDKREFLHARIIRDADKLDNCRVKLEDSIETILEVTAEEAGAEEISPEVMEQFLRRESILSGTRKTKMDYWLSYLAYFFDINFDASWEMIRENHYIEKLIGRIPYSNPKTAADMETVRRILLAAERSGCGA